MAVNAVKYDYYGSCSRVAVHGNSETARKYQYGPEKYHFEKTSGGKSVSEPFFCAEASGDGPEAVK